MDLFDTYLYEFRLIEYLDDLRRAEHSRGVHLQIHTATELRTYRRIPILGIYQEESRVRTAEKNIWSDPSYKAIVNSFCDKFKLDLYEYSSCHIPDYFKTPEEYLRIQNSVGRHNSTETITYQIYLRCRTPDARLQEIKKQYVDAMPQNLFRAGMAFYQKVNQNEIVNQIASHFSSGCNVQYRKIYNVTICLDSFKYWDQEWGEQKTRTFKSCGMKDLSSIKECAGLAFAVIDKFIDPMGLTVSDVIDSNTSATSPVLKAFTDGLSYVSLSISYDPIVQSPTILKNW